MSELYTRKIIASLAPSIKETLEAGERNRINCYLQHREWQLERFQIGWTKDWSQAELIFVLRQKIKTIKKMKRMGRFGRLRTLAPMFRAALTVEIELAKQEAA